MSWSLTAVNKTRYLNDTKRALVQFLAHHLADTTGPWAALFTRVGGGVDVYGRDPGLPAVDKLSKPRLVIWLEGEQKALTNKVSAGHSYEAAYCTLSYAVQCVADANTGGQITTEDLAGAVQQICELHRADLEGAGLLLLEARVGSTEEDTKTGRWSNKLTVRVEITLLGAQMT